MNRVKEKFLQEFRHKLLLTASFIFIYLLGSKIPLPVIGFSTFDNNSLSFLMFTGFRNNGSLFSLGVSPYITASIFFGFWQMANSSKSSKKQTMQKSAILATFIAIFQAVIYIGSFANLEINIIIFDILGLVIGSTIVMFMAIINDKKGIGSTSVFILITVVVSQISRCAKIMIAVSENKLFFTILMLIFVYIAVIVIYVIIDRAEYRIPYLQLNIKSAYSSKSYFPIKLNCTNVSPIMFTSAMFSMLVAFMIFVMEILFYDSDFLNYIKIFLKNDYFCLILYSIMLLFFCVFMAFTMINPSKISDEMKKNNECLAYLKPGETTKIYLTKYVLLFSLINGLILILAICGPIFLCIQNGYGFRFGFQISSIFFMVGMIVKFIEEFAFECKLFSYKGILG